MSSAVTDTRGSLLSTQSFLFPELSALRWQKKKTASQCSLCRALSFTLFQDTWSVSCSSLFRLLPPYGAAGWQKKTRTCVQLTHVKVSCTSSVMLSHRCGKSKVCYSVTHCIESASHCTSNCRISRLFFRKKLAVWVCLPV